MHAHSSVVVNTHDILCTYAYVARVGSGSSLECV
jgi:hypothetical protein